MNQKKLKQDISKSPSKVLNTFVKNEDGTIYQVVPHKTKDDLVYLRLKNKYISKSFIAVKQSVVNGKMKVINVHEYKAWMKEDHEYMMGLSQKLIKRTLITQILLELDDELQEDFEGDKYFRNVLEKSKKQCERIANEQYDRIYNANNQYTNNFLRNIDKVASQCVKIGVQDYAHLSVMLDDYIKNPDKHQKETVQVVKIDS